MSMDTIPPVPTEIPVGPALAEPERLALRSKAAKEAAANRTAGSGAPTADPARLTKKPRRRHAARSARYLSLALSALATVVLTVTFSLLSLPSIDQFALAAMPILRAEALTAQSANVDTISGASVTSRGYATSLRSAIDAAQAAGAINL